MKVIRSWLGYQAEFYHTVCLDCDKEKCSGECKRFYEEMRKYRKKTGNKKTRKQYTTV